MNKYEKSFISPADDIANKFNLYSHWILSSINTHNVGAITGDVSMCYYNILMHSIMGGMFDIALSEVVGADLKIDGG